MSEDFSLTVDNYAEFWGTRIESDFPTELLQDFAIHIVMACIDINEEMAKQEPNSPNATLWLQKGNDRYQVCQLSREWRQQPLHLFFEKKLGARFFVVGDASVYIYGYRLKDVEEDRLRTEDEDPLSSSPNNKSPLGKYSHIIDTTCYTISDDDDNSGSSLNSELSRSSSTSNSGLGYTTESTARSVSLGSSTSSESPAERKK